jgi:hypothetical protein
MRLKIFFSAKACVLAKPFRACLIRAKKDGSKKAGQAQQGHFPLFDTGALAASRGGGGHFPLSLLARAACPLPSFLLGLALAARAGESLATAGAVAGSRWKGKLPRVLLAYGNP